MARYKYYSYEQAVMIPVDFSAQILPGTIEHTISLLVDNRIDLSGISKRFKPVEGFNFNKAMKVLNKFDIKISYEVVLTIKLLRVLEKSKSLKD